MSLLHGSIAESTRSSYDRGFSSYLVFVRQHGAAFPPTESSLIGFATWLFTAVAKSAATTRAYVTGLRGGCVELGYDVRPFEAPRLSRLYRGMARARRAVSKPRRLPITVALLFLIITKVWSPAGKLIPCAAAVVQFFGGFRCGELCYNPQTGKQSVMTRRQVTWHSDRAVIFLAQSKTDYIRKGADVTVFRIGGPLCPHAWLAAVLRGAPDQRPEAALFQWPDGHTLLYSEMLGELKSALHGLGYDTSKFGTHSIRVGIATTMAQLGYSGEQIRATVRWNSDCYQRYVRLTPDFLRGVARALGAEDVVKGHPFGGLSLEAAAKAEVDNIEELFSEPRRPVVGGYPRGVNGPSDAVSIPPNTVSTISAASGRMGIRPNLNKEQVAARYGR